MGRGNRSFPPHAMLRRGQTSGGTSTASVSPPSTPQGRPTRNRRGRRARLDSGNASLDGDTISTSPSASVSSNSSSCSTIPDSLTSDSNALRCSSQPSTWASFRDTSIASPPPRKRHCGKSIQNETSINDVVSLDAVRQLFNLPLCSLLALEAPKP